MSGIEPPTYGLRNRKVKKERLQMTIEQIRRELKPVKPLSRERLYFYFRKFKIKRLGMRQVPAHYPQDTTQRILFKLGLVNGKLKLTPKTSKSRN